MPVNTRAYLEISHAHQFSWNHILVNIGGYDHHILCLFHIQVTKLSHTTILLTKDKVVNPKKIKQRNQKLRKLNIHISTFLIVIISWKHCCWKLLNISEIVCRILKNFLYIPHFLLICKNIVFPLKSKASLEMSVVKQKT